MDVSSDGQRLIRNWMAAASNVECAKQAVNRTECALTNATNELARWLLPDDAKVGEKISVWFGDSLVQVEKTSDNPTDGTVTIRKRGRSLDRAA